MNTEFCVTRSPLVAIELYWRTHNDYGRLAARDQAWWVLLIDEDGVKTREELDSGDCWEVCDMLEAVIKIGETFGLCFGPDQVRIDTRRMQANWQQGN